MLRKVTLALVAAASLSAMALAPTTASAGPWGGGWGGGFHHHWGHGFGIGFIGGGYDGCYVTRSVLTPYGYRLRTVNVCGY
jgi:Spy/CpxP family protein refolding chaperone